MSKRILGRFCQSIVPLICGFLLPTLVNLHAAATVTTTDFNSGSALSSSTMNSNFSSVRTALNKLNPNGWTNGGTDIGYTDGRIGIGVASPFGLLHLSSADGSSTKLLLADMGQAINSRYWRMGNYTDGKLRFDAVSDDQTTTVTNVLTMQRNGNVGIGTSSPAQNLHISNASQSIIRLSGSTGNSHWGVNSAVAYLTTESAIPLAFYTNAAERMRIDSSGNVGIGTTSPGANLDVASDTAKIRLSRPSNGRAGYVSVINTQGGLRYHGGVNGGGETTSVSHQFTGDSPSADTIYMTILGSGNLGIGTTSPQAKLHVGPGALINSTAADNFQILTFGATPNPNFTISKGNGVGGASVHWLYGDSGNRVGVNIPTASDPTGTCGASSTLCVNGAVYSNGSALTSDARWKKEITPITFKRFDSAKEANLRSVSGTDATGWQQFLELTPSTYFWRTGEFKDMNFEAGRQFGFIAQNVEGSYPDLVKANGKGYKSLNYAGIIAINTAAIQQLKREKDAENARLLSAVEASERRAQAAEARAAALETKVALLERNQSERFARLERALAATTMARR